MKKIFPNDFFFGVADADLQVISESKTLEFENSAPTMWTELAKSSGAVWQNETPLDSVNRYEKFSEDAALIKDLGVKHYRTSISMSRILNAQQEVNEKAIQWYRNYFSALRENGIKIYATLYHWELPLYLHNQGGWTNRLTAKVFEKHCSVVADRLGDLIDEYYIINEHVCIVFLGYHQGMHAPFEKDTSKALMAAHNLLLAQGLGFNAVKAINPAAKVSTVCNPAPVYLAQPTKENKKIHQLAIDYCSDWFLDPIYKGSYPAALAEYWKEFMPQLTSLEEDMAIIKIGSQLNCLGLNYYFGQQISFEEPSEKGKFPWKGDFEQFQVRNSLGWPVFVPPAYPEGLYDLLVRTYNKYAEYGLNNIAITENGAAWKNEGADPVSDCFRIEYVKSHLEQVHKALCAGVPIEGYFLWTLLDNYEWQEGYKPESAFGIVRVDPETKERFPKESYYWYQGLVKKRIL